MEKSRTEVREKDRSAEYKLDNQDRRSFHTLRFPSTEEGKKTQPQSQRS